MKKNRKVYSTQDDMIPCSQSSASFIFQSYAAHSCLSVAPHPDIVEFDSADVFGGINMELEDVNNKDLERVH